MSNHLENAIEERKCAELLINKLLNFCDLRSCIGDKKFWKYLSRLQSSDCYEKIINEINRLLKCINCSNRGETMECGHALCKKCALKSCVICNNPPSKSDSKKFNRVKCLVCLQDTIYENYFIDTCMHMCKRCAVIEATKGRTRCRICKVSFNNLEGLSTYPVKCTACEGDAPLREGYTLACNHFFCINCLGPVKKRRRCMECQRGITNYDLCALINFNQIQCESCKQYVEITLFPKKSCCEKDICSGCQGGFCKFCNL